MLGKESEHTKGLQWSQLWCQAKPVWNRFPYRLRLRRTGLHLFVLASQKLPLSACLVNSYQITDLASQLFTQSSNFSWALKFFNRFTHTEFPSYELKLEPPHPNTHTTQVGFFTDLFFRAGFVDEGQLYIVANNPALKSDISMSNHGCATS